MTMLTTATVTSKIRARSGLEVEVQKILQAQKIRFKYEPFRIPYIPTKTRHYIPDILLPNGIIIEVKGRFLTSDRQKHLMVQQQHPYLDIRFVFSNARTRISKQSKTTYAMWCERYGFHWSTGIVPPAWLEEEADPRTLLALQQLER